MGTLSWHSEWHTVLNDELFLKFQVAAFPHITKSPHKRRQLGKAVTGHPNTLDALSLDRAAAISLGI